MTAANKQSALTEPTLMILLALWTAPLHGYGIRREIRGFSRGRIQLGNGTVYETLPRLEQIGWIRAVQDVAPVRGRRERRLYELTENGRKALCAEHSRLRQLCELLSKVGISESRDGE